MPQTLRSDGPEFSLVWAAEAGEQYSHLPRNLSLMSSGARRCTARPALWTGRHIPGGPEFWSVLSEEMIFPRSDRLTPAATLSKSLSVMGTGSPARARPGKAAATTASAKIDLLIGIPLMRRLPLIPDYTPETQVSTKPPRHPRFTIGLWPRRNASRDGASQVPHFASFSPAERPLVAYLRHTAQKSDADPIKTVPARS